MHMCAKEKYDKLINFFFKVNNKFSCVMKKLM